MKRNKTLLIILSLLVGVVIVVGSVYRISDLNSDLEKYMVHDVEISAGERINISNLDLEFGKVSNPILKESVDYEGKKTVYYQLPIIIENKGNEEKNLLDGSMQIFVNYKTFYDAAIINLQKKNDTNNTFDILSHLKVGEPVNIIAESNLIEGELFHYYSDYGKDKQARIVFLSSPSENGVKAYYYNLNQ
jgi:hypothetical protein